MAKKPIASSARDRLAARSGRTIPDKEIDFSDIPELTHEQLKKMKRPGRPLLSDSPRHLIAIRLDTTVLKRIKAEAKREGKGYQSLINEILIRYTKRKAA